MKRLSFKNNIPQILSLAEHRAEEWAEHSWKWLYSLRQALIYRVERQKRQSTRTMRSDQRKAIERLLSVIISHIDLKTMQLGYYQKDTGIFIHLGIHYLAKKAQLSPRRTQRALQWLHESGYITAFRQSIFDDLTQSYLHKPSVRKVHEKLFYELGITQQALRNARQRSAQRNQRHGFRMKLEKNLSNVAGSLGTSIAELITLPHNVTERMHSPLNSTSYKDKLRKLSAHFPDLGIEEIKMMLPSK